MKFYNKTSYKNGTSEITQRTFQTCEHDKYTKRIHSIIKMNVGHSFIASSPVNTLKTPVFLLYVRYCCLSIYLDMILYSYYVGGGFAF